MWKTQTGLEIKGLYKNIKIDQLAIDRQCARQGLGEGKGCRQTGLETYKNIKIDELATDR